MLLFFVPNRAYRHKPYTACTGYLKTRIFIFQVAHATTQSTYLFRV